ncbi:MAG: type IV conjugative transfer system lipoprotein TraV [Dictyoglomus turgidum]
MGRIKLLVVFLFLLVVGCASALNPYHGEFECPQMEKGKCVSIPEAYNESINGVPKQKDKTLSLEEPPRQTEVLVSQYQEELFKKMTQLLKEPKTPLVVPPRVVRVMILPYMSDDSKEFYSARYVYVIVEDPQWTLQNLLALPPEDGQ